MLDSRDASTTRAEDPVNLLRTPTEQAVPGSAAIARDAQGPRRPAVPRRSIMSDDYAVEQAEQLSESDQDLRFKDQIIASLNEMIRLYTRVADLYAQRHGLTGQQLPALMTLIHRGPLSVTALAHLLDMGSSSVTPLTRRLEELGFVERVRDVLDARIVHVTATSRCREVIMAIYGDIADDAERSQQKLSDDERGQVLDAMARLQRLLTSLYDVRSADDEGSGAQPARDGVD